ncbi:MAG: hypothetical protein V7763_09110 [Sulfitobacter sp.]
MAKYGRGGKSLAADAFQTIATLNPAWFTQEVATTLTSTLSFVRRCRYRIVKLG